MLLALAVMTWVTMMLGLAAERVLAVEEELLALVASAASGGGAKGGILSQHIAASGAAAVAVGPARYCPPHHQIRVEPFQLGGFCAKRWCRGLMIGSIGKS